LHPVTRTSRGGEENQEEKSDNASEHKTHKKEARIELQGEFRKIKPPSLMVNKKRQLKPGLLI
jgi:hypothetical protein